MTAGVDDRSYEITEDPAPRPRRHAFFRTSPTMLCAAFVLAVISLLALFAPLIAPQNPYHLASLNFLDGMSPPLTRGSSGLVFWLGSDEQGRDMLSAIMYGMRTSLTVGLVATGFAVVLGSMVGVIAAFVGGAIDAVLMRLSDLQLSFPAILISLMLVAIFGRGVQMVIIALIAVQWAYYARAVRGVALSELRREYIEAAKCLSLSNSRIIFRHLLPSTFPTLIVIATVQLAHAIALEATLSFLGVGVPVTEPSLGMLIASGYGFLLSGEYWVSMSPGVALIILVLSINLLGDHLRDALNPRLAK